MTLSNLRLRVLSALALGPIALFVTWLGGVSFVALTAICGLALIREWCLIVGVSETSATGVSAYAVVLAVAAGWFFISPDWLLLFLCVGAGLIVISGKGKPDQRWVAEGVVYTGLSVIALNVLRHGSAGAYVSFFLILTVWATDIAAYFTGRAFGGPKLWPRVSPKKTWSGAIGGAAAAVVTGVVFQIVSGFGAVAVTGAAALLLSVVSQAGDLLESALKRRFGVKDSGALIPGHGGVLDRVDGLIAAAVVLFVLAAGVSGNLHDPIGGLLTIFTGPTGA